MSMEAYALCAGAMPGVAEWQAAIHENGFDLKLDAARKPVVLVRPGEDCFEGRHDCRIELRFYGLCKAEPGHTTWHGVAIRAVSRPCVVRVCHGDDPG